MTFQWNRQTKLLTLVVVLAAIKFGYLPVLDAIGEQKTQLVKLKERAAKGEIVKNEVEAMLQQEATLDSNLSAFREQFQSVTSMRQVQFDIQQQIENKAKETGVRLSSLEWLNHFSGTPSSSLIEIKVEAEMKDLMLFHSEIDDIGFDVITSDFRFRVTRQLLSRSRLGNVSGDMQLRFFYFVEDDR